MAIEEAAYTVLLRDGRFEIRDYAPQRIAEVIVEGSLEDAGNRAFRPLFRYIDGHNRARPTTTMTERDATSRKIAMTAPVGQEAEGDRWRVSFMMPQSFTLETLPQPEDPAVSLREIPARRMAAIRYRGFWTESGYLRHRDRLTDWIAAQELSAVGEPVWARYNPPFTPWFLRRNEILIPIASTP
ncbi:MAG TPA: heme-binding protein [Kiritimatiellia bacterium]|nr:heme-binding protein [Kiritimatiellia bacterium]HMO98958.1 heme-binding protein [Kiritimatiellia bacterium]HMP95710.1 heme-binding protein [Kiritimatiellia bacterium]